MEGSFCLVLRLIRVQYSLGDDKNKPWGVYNIHAYRGRKRRANTGFVLVAWVRV